SIQKQLQNSWIKGSYSGMQKQQSNNRLGAAKHHVPEKGAILVETENEIGHVIINNPKYKNAFNRQMCQQLVEVMRSLDEDPAVKVISVRGAEGNFSAGANLKNLDEVLFSGADE